MGGCCFELEFHGIGSEGECTGRSRGWTTLAFVNWLWEEANMAKTAAVAAVAAGDERVGRRRRR